jgi:hypothetical protein
VEYGSNDNLGARYNSYGSERKFRQWRPTTRNINTNRRRGAVDKSFWLTCQNNAMRRQPQKERVPRPPSGVGGGGGGLRRQSRIPKQNILNSEGMLKENDMS